ncbi:co-chaperone GroES [Empedobacter sp.]|uniref:co-chaperone GroES n=1 Tax=Empedobacter sp. TaxID=1927715 RepID=UPI000E8B9904|nr:co-chaperone GroES [Empedobacter sp.]HAD78784.1 co-chaperone GroES [Flavobacteriaceae bacterium]HBX62779.1 co-chaperone GroES [Flavobacteriaceae bacterium]
MSQLNIKPVTGSQVRVIIELAPLETKTASGIIIPTSAQERPQEGIIIEVGNETETEKLTVKIGYKVIYRKHSGIEYSHNGKDYLILKEDDIIAFYK